MNRISKEFKTGITYVLVLILFIWGFLFVKKENLFGKKFHTFHTEYNNIQGLSNSSTVTLNGLEVGKISQIALSKDPSKKGVLEVYFTVDPAIEFSNQSIVKIYSTSLMGGKSLAIVPSYTGKTATTGDFLNGEIESDILSSFSEKLNPIQSNLENVIVRADKLMQGLNQILNDDSRSSIKNSIQSLNATVSNFENTSHKLNNIVSENEKNISTTIQNSKKATDNLAKISDDLSNAQIGETLKKLNSSILSLNNILSSIEKGEGTLGKLTYNDKLYNNLTNASKELEELLRDFKLHPKRFVHFSLFGKKDKGFKSNNQ